VVETERLSDIASINFITCIANSRLSNFASIDLLPCTAAVIPIPTYVPILSAITTALACSEPRNGNADEENSTDKERLQDCCDTCVPKFLRRCRNLTVYPPLSVFKIDSCGISRFASQERRSPFCTPIRLDDFSKMRAASECR
jgi:hypothetical protein